jgi:hypothetical protein
VDIVSDYISNQKKHHNTVTAKDEYIQLLEENGVEFDERYI